MNDIVTITVWAVVWDTKTGTDCTIFGTEGEADAFMAEIILTDIERSKSETAQKIQALLKADLGNVVAAFELSQEHLKDPLDTYQWGSHAVRIPTVFLNRA